MSTNPTWYDLLGVAPDASTAEIKAAWRDATDKFEPGSGTSQFRLFNEAADVLLNPERRAEYDAGLVAAPSTDAEPAAPAVASAGAPAPDVEPAPSGGVDLAKAPPVVDDAVPDETLAPPPPQEAPAESSRRGGPLGPLAAVPTLVLAIMAVVMVAAIVLATVIGMRLHDRVQVSDAGPEASAAAERALTSVLSYDYRHMSADRDRAARFLTPSYRKQYVKNFDDLLTKGPEGSPGPAEKTQAVVTADVLDTAVVDAESNRVRVLVFVNQSSVKAGGQPTTFQDRVVATMVQHDGSWLVDNIKSY